MSIPTTRVWAENVVIPTYGTGEPDQNPMFFEKRVYQGSSGVVYPNPVIETISDTKADKTYHALFLENEYLKIMILPELGGRVQLAWDKIKKRHFIYYNQVVKPALVGLTGPWISGGIEFNWPQHHRPSTFEPVDHALSENADGSVTVWISEVEKMFRTKATVAFTLYPGKAYLEIRANLYNRTELPQTFLWWANPAVKVNDHYQSVFPSDVNAVFDHGKRDVSAFPIATGTYYKVDYSPGTDISRYKNIPVPTSYMAINSSYDFMGGYEHDTRAGLLHVADRRVSPGKKQWTWGHSDFGVAWDRNLTDEDGPYIELMTGVFTDNQPDFSWLMPYEEKSFTQYFLPYRELGLVKNASKDVLISTVLEADRVTIRVFATSMHKQVRVLFSIAGNELLNELADIDPESIFEREVPLQEPAAEKDFQLRVLSSGDKELIRYEPRAVKTKDFPEPARPALAPSEIGSNEQLFLTGLHLEQYRHATYSPLPYYEEALKRDPGDTRCNNALGVWYLRRGRFEKAEPFFRKAIDTQLARNPNPYDGEFLYNLGLCLVYLENYDEAYEAFAKSTWNAAWQDKSAFAIARISLRKNEPAEALRHLEFSLDRNAGNGKARVLRAAAFRKLGMIPEALATCEEALIRDRFNSGILFEKSLLLGTDGGPGENTLATLLDLSRGSDHHLTEYALDYAAAGLYREAIQLLELVPEENRTPMNLYYRAYFFKACGQPAEELLRQASGRSSYLCFPNRLEDIAPLRFALESNPADAKAPYYLGNLYYDKRQYDEAISLWELSCLRDPDFPTVHRNLGMAAFNQSGDAEKALHHYQEAFNADPGDARVLMELDQLYKRLNKPVAFRLRFLENNLGTVARRDDLYLERAAMYNFLGNHQNAYDLVMNRTFHPWEGGEGKVSGQYTQALVGLAKKSADAGNYRQSIDLLLKAKQYPPHIGEGKLYGAAENDIDYLVGCAWDALGEPGAARKFWKQAAEGSLEPGSAVFYNDQQPDKILYRALALQKLGESQQAERILNGLVNYGRAHAKDKVLIDYFAVSLPDLLIFEDDLDSRNNINCRYLAALGMLGLGKTTIALDALHKVLLDDAMHAGAQTHVDLIESGLFAV